MPRSSFKRFRKKSSMQTQAGGKHTIYYSILMHDHSDNKMVVGLGFKGESQANAAIRLIARELGLQFDQQPPAANDDGFGDDSTDFDVLRSDR